jgi:hypothetical protein
VTVKNPGDYLQGLVGRRSSETVRLSVLERRADAASR